METSEAVEASQNDSSSVAAGPLASFPRKQNRFELESIKIKMFQY